MASLTNTRGTGILLAALILIVAGCGSSPNKNALLNTDTGKHSAAWLTDHPAAYIKDKTVCAECHGADLHGGISRVSCFSATFNGVSCHAAGPAGHPAGWASPDAHGVAAKSAADIAAMTGFSTCQACHGAPFTGGAIAPSCVGTAGCHGAGIESPHSPAPWRGAGRRHSNTNTGNAANCALCHLSGRTPPSYVPLLSGGTGSQPGCFNNTLCHGSDVMPHPLPFTDPTLHGPMAKADLTLCEACHAAPSSGSAGSNPRFNVAIGGLQAGCESTGCHAANLAHPAQWRGWTVTAPGGHRTAGNMANACALCHGATLAGGTGPACSACHKAGSPLTLTNCTSCHAVPPAGSAAPNRPGAHPTHGSLADVVANGCGTCHNGGGSGTVNHAYQRTTPYVSALPQYNAKTGTAAFNAATNTCSNVSCHGGQTTPDWLTGVISVNTQCASCHTSGSTQYNGYYSGHHGTHISEGLACTECHDTAKLAFVHFNDLNTTALTEAWKTLLNGLNYTGTGGGNFGTCTLTCHGETHSNRSW